MSTVDVIVPCYRYAHFLRQCVESVLTQSGPDVRVLILDDASPDNTPEVAAELAKNDSRVTVRRHSTNMRHIATYNEGIEWVSADFMLLLSADDYLLPGALNRAAKLMEQSPNVGFVFGNAVELHEHGHRLRTDAVPCNNGERILGSQEFFRLSGARNIVPTPTAIIRTKLQKKVGGYRAELPHAGDMEMWLRLAAHASVGFVEEPQAVYRKHSENMSLSYVEHSLLPDLEQRAVALNYFLYACADILENASWLRRYLFYLLALDAVHQASSSFNRGQFDICESLLAFARRTSSRVTRSLPWAKLACKRLMGPTLWRALQPIANEVRGGDGVRIRRRIGAGSLSLPVQAQEQVIEK